MGKVAGISTAKTPQKSVSGRTQQGDRPPNRAESLDKNNAGDRGRRFSGERRTRVKIVGRGTGNDEARRRAEYHCFVSRHHPCTCDRSTVRIQDAALSDTVISPPAFLLLGLRGLQARARKESKKERKRNGDGKRFHNKIVPTYTRMKLTFRNPLRSSVLRRSKIFMPWFWFSPITHVSLMPT